MDTVKTGRIYQIEGLGPASLSFEKRQVRSAAVQAVRDFINDNWTVEPNGKAVRISLTVRVVGVDSGGRKVAVEAEGMDLWVSD